MAKYILPEREEGWGWKEVGLVLLSTSENTLCEYSHSIHTFIYLHREGRGRLGAKMWRTVLLHKSVWAQDLSGKKRLQIQMPDRTFAGLHVPEPVDLEVAKYQKKTLLSEVGFNKSYKGIKFLQQFSTPYKTLCRRPLIFQTIC